MGLPWWSRLRLCASTAGGMVLCPIGEVRCSMSCEKKKKKAIIRQVPSGGNHQVVSNSCNPVDCSPPGSSVHGILQARILEWVAILSPGALPHPGIEPRSPALQADSFPAELPGEPQAPPPLPQLPPSSIYLSVSN